MSATGVIVVGVDGSPGSKIALEYAVDEALLRNSAVLAVTAFDVPWSAGPAQNGAEADLAEQIELRARSWVEEALRDRQARPEIRLCVRSGDAARVLREESARGDLLVVGHRGLDGISSTVLGSVGLSCMLYAPCSVTVVRAAGQRSA